MIIDFRKGGGGTGPSIKVEALEATENRIYEAPSGKAYSPVIVNVPSEKLDLSGTGWESEKEFPVSVARQAQLKEDIEYTKQKYSEWDPNQTAAGNFYQNDMKLVYAPKVDFSKLEPMFDFFMGCENLVSVPELNTSKNTDFDQFFLNCKKLSYVPKMDTLNAQTLLGTFYGCSSLVKAPKLFTGKATSISQIFQYCSSLTSIEFEGGLKAECDCSGAFYGIAENGVLYLHVGNGITKANYQPVIDRIPSTWTVEYITDELVEVEDKKTVEITSNGTTEIVPASGYQGIAGATVNVNVPVPPEKKLQEKTLPEITANGPQSITPDSGFDGISKLDFTVNVPTGGGGSLNYSKIGYTSQNTANMPYLWDITADDITKAANNKKAIGERQTWDGGPYKAGTKLMPYFAPDDKTFTQVNYDGALVPLDSFPDLEYIPDMDFSKTKNDGSVGFQKPLDLSFVPQEAQDATNAQDTPYYFANNPKLKRVGSLKGLLDWINKPNFGHFYMVAPFYGMFLNDKSLEEAPTIVLPKNVAKMDTSSDNYLITLFQAPFMFYGCTSLKRTPKFILPETSENGEVTKHIGSWCRTYLGCTSLEEADLIDFKGFTKAYNVLDDVFTFDGVFNSLRDGTYENEHFYLQPFGSKKTYKGKYGIGDFPASPELTKLTKVTGFYGCTLGVDLSCLPNISGDSLIDIANQVDNYVAEDFHSSKQDIVHNEFLLHPSLETRIPDAVAKFREILTAKGYTVSYFTEPAA